ncbi:MAG: flagellar biosynthesis protein FlhF [Oceanospirillaceae bacterium]|nr:flagellar biosynthesis protein FlhF [Oceanospirillaceae bacterium]MCP5350061.1 flagellar biosynthesis protein FlhF [Oceanospirillaceae bacterium]
MKVRRFTAPTMQKALKKVSDEMGPDAVILSNHRVNGGVEIIVAQQYEKAPSVPRFDPQEQDDVEAVISPAAAQKIKASQAAKDPWPFLNDAQKHEVEKQLQLQDEIEQLQKKRGKKPAPAQAPAAAFNVDSKASLSDMLSSIKQGRGQNEMAAPKAAAPAPQMQMAGKFMEDMRAELNDLKELLKAKPEQNSAAPVSFVWKKYAPSNALQAKFWGRLEHMGVADWLIFQLVNGVQPHNDESAEWQKVLHHLTDYIHVSPADKLKRGGVFALVGPTGAGKTTTIAKMAVRYTLEHQDAKVGLITMDNYRLAAHDQLRTLGQILGVPVQVCDAEHPLTRCLATLSDCDLVLIDTAGISDKNPLQREQLAELHSVQGRVQTLLTLPATSQGRVLKKVLHSYQSAGLSGAILTKMDEASCLGEAISLFAQAGLPVAYCTDGQRIPDDFHVANAKALVKRSVQIAQHEQHAVTGTESRSAASW